MTELDVRDTEIRVRVAGITFRMASPDQNGPALAVPPASRQFLPPAGGAADIDLIVRWGDLSSSAPARQVFDSGGTWRLFREGPLDVFRFWAEDRATTPFLECRMRLDGCAGEVILHRDYYDPARPVSALQYPLDELLMVHHLARGKGVELHACGVVTADGRGLLFVGQSGDGKTTTARLWESRVGTLVLSDDRIVVREEAGEFLMHGTPWHGEAQLAVDGRAPIDAVFVLEHGSENEARQLTASEATALLAARSFVPFHDVGALEWSLSFLDRFARAVPCHRFAFVPAESALDFLDRWSRAGSEGSPSERSGQGSTAAGRDGPGRSPLSAILRSTPEPESTPVV